MNGLIRRRFGYYRSLVRDNAREIGKDRGRGRKRSAEKGSARLHESLPTPSCTDKLAIETAKTQMGEQAARRRFDV
jgi:hypothetical protein